MCTLIAVDAKLTIFGSSANGFGSRSSDLDICMTIPGHDKVQGHNGHVMCKCKSMYVHIFNIHVHVQCHKVHVSTRRNSVTRS